jgi:hypothetical protein
VDVDVGDVGVLVDVFVDDIVLDAIDDIADF